MGLLELGHGGHELGCPMQSAQLSGWAVAIAPTLRIPDDRYAPRGVLPKSLGGRAHRRSGE